MSLFSKLRSAEHEGREAAWQGWSRARTSLEEAQSRLRRKMRIHPHTVKPPLPLGLSREQRQSRELSHPIVNINGEDLPPEDQGAPKEQIA